VDYTKPAVDLSKEKEFMAFYKFHTNVCALWNDVIDEIMKNDCVDPASKCPPKPQYITNVKNTFNETASPKICFAPCETQWGPTSSLKELELAIPEKIDCYKGTLQYIVDKSQEMITKVEDAMARIPAPDSFADYQATINCKSDANGAAICTDANGNTYIAQKPKPQELEQSEQDLLAQQIASTNKVITRCRFMNSEIPALNALGARAKANVDKLHKIKQKAENGDLLPPPAKA